MLSLKLLLTTVVLVWSEAAQSVADVSHQAILAHETGRDADALTLFEKAISMEKERGDSRDLASLYRAALGPARAVGNRDRLAMVLRGIVSLGVVAHSVPPLSEISELAQLLEGAGDIQEALQVYLRGLELSPSTHHFHNGAGSLRLRLGQGLLASHHFRAALDIGVRDLARGTTTGGADHPRADLYAYNLGLSLFQAGDFNGALAAFDQANRSTVDRAPFPEAEYRMGLSLDELGRFDEAILALGFVVERFIGPDRTKVAPRIGGGLSQVRWDLHNALISCMPPRHQEGLRQLLLSMEEESGAPLAKSFFVSNSGIRTQIKKKKKAKKATKNSRKSEKSTFIRSTDPRLVYGALHLSRYIANWKVADELSFQAFETLKIEFETCTKLSIADDFPCRTDLTPMRAMAWAPGEQLARVVASWQISAVKDSTAAFGDVVAQKRSAAHLLWARHGSGVARNSPSHVSVSENKIGAKSSSRKKKRATPGVLSVGYVSADFGTLHPMTPIVLALLHGQRRWRTRNHRTLRVVCFNLGTRARARAQSMLQDKSMFITSSTSPSKKLPLCDKFVDLVGAKHGDSASFSAAAASEIPPGLFHGLSCRHLH